jgi:hypothetical protein
MKGLFIGDKHSGSSFGLCPRRMDSFAGFSDEVSDETLALLAPVPGADGPLPPLSLTQNWLWDCWENFLGQAFEYIGDDDFFLVEMGDSSEGRHHGTTELMSQDILVHLWIAHEIIRPITKHPQNCATYIMKGTECHSRTLESSLGKMVDAVRNPKTGDWAWPHLQLDVNGFRVHCQHHMPVSTVPWTRSGAFSKELIREQANAAAHRHRIPDIVVRAHRHQAGVYREASGMLCASGPWQALTRFGARVTYDWRVFPGGLVIDFDKIRADGWPDAEAFVYKPAEDPPQTIVSPGESQ